MERNTSPKCSLIRASHMIIFVVRYVVCMPLQIIKKKGYCKKKHDMTTTCRQGKVEQLHIKSKRGHSYYFAWHNCWTQQCVGPIVFWTFVLFTITRNMPSKYAKFWKLGPFKILFLKQNSNESLWSIINP